MWGKWKKLSRTYRYFLTSFIILAAINAVISIYSLIMTARFDSASILFLILLFIDFFISLFIGTIGFIIARVKRDKITKPEIGFATFIGLIIALSVYMSFPYTKPLTGKVVDAKTNKPIKGAYVEVDWRAGFLIESSRVYKSRVYITNSDGSFKVPASIDHLWFPLEAFDMQEIIVFAHGYHYKANVKYKVFDKRVNYLIPKAIYTNSKIKLSPISSEQEWEKNWKALKENMNLYITRPPNLTEKITGFLAKDTEIFAGKFPNSPLAPKLMLKGAEEVRAKRLTKVLKAYQLIINMFPNSDEAKVAKRSIDVIKQDPDFRVIK